MIAVYLAEMWIGLILITGFMKVGNRLDRIISLLERKDP